MVIKPKKIYSITMNIIVFRVCCNSMELLLEYIIKRERDWERLREKGDMTHWELWIGNIVNSICIENSRLAFGLENNNQTYFCLSFCLCSFNIRQVWFDLTLIITINHKSIGIHFSKTICWMALIQSHPLKHYFNSSSITFVVLSSLLILTLGF